jgi:hypothetical protein
MQTRRTLQLPGDARAAPQPGSTGLRRSDPPCTQREHYVERPRCGRAAATHSAQSSSPAPRERGDQVRRAWWVRAAPPSEKLRSLSSERACPGCDPGSGSGGARPLTTSLIPRRPRQRPSRRACPREGRGDAPAPIPHSLACPPAKARGLDPRGGLPQPNPCRNRPRASCLRAGDAHRIGITTHPEN